MFIHTSINLLSIRDIHYSTPRPNPLKKRVTIYYNNLNKRYPMDICTFSNKIVSIVLNICIIISCVNLYYKGENERGGGPD